MERYSISTVEQLTGIKAHTLRIWEKRYRSLLPHRTETNIRYYDDEQLKKLLNISTLLHHGHKISKLSQYSDKELAVLLNSLYESNDPSAKDVHLDMLITHMLSFDERSFDKVISNAIIKFGFYEAVIHIIYPFLRKTGLLWSISSVAPAQEHFASNIIRRKLLTAIDGIPFPAGIKGKFILFLPPGEWHEIGLLVADFLVRKAGGESIYLGQNVPLASLECALKEIRPPQLLTFFNPGTDRSIIGDLAALAGKYKARLLAYCPVELQMPFKSITYLSSPDSLLMHI